MNSHGFDNARRHATLLGCTLQARENGWGLIARLVLWLTLAPAVLGAPLAAPTARAAAIPWCGVGVLHVTIGGHDAGVGNIYTTVVLRNVGRGSCTLRGDPGISLVDGRGRQLGGAATRIDGDRPWLVLRPGGTVSTVIHTLNPGVGTTKCLPPSASLRVYPPDSYTPVLVRVRLSECLGVLEVHPLVAGSTGT
jgi:hypothetical protein